MSVPTDPNELKKLKLMIVEMTHAMSRADGEKEHIKTIASEAAEQFGIQKKLVNKIARTMYKSNYASLQEENEQFELLYESVTGGNT